MRSSAERVHGGPASAVAIALTLLGLVLSLATIRLFPSAVVDDAFISLRYVDNLLAGRGLVFNPGERVEGVTNLGFILVIAGFAALGIDPLAAARILGLLGGAAAVLLAPAAIAPNPRQLLERALARALLLSNFFFVFFAWTGLETGFYSGLLAAMALTCQRGGMRFSLAVGFLGALACLVRPDGLLMVLACWMACVVGRPGFPRRDLAGWLPVLLLGAASLLFRKFYFNAWVPNTALVKGGFALVAQSKLPWYGTFGDDLAEFFSTTGGVFLLFMVFLALSLSRDRRGLVLGLLICASGLTFEIYAGGDWMMGYRFLQPMLPFYFALAAVGLVSTVRMLFPHGLGWIKGAAAALLIVIAMLHGWSQAIVFKRNERAYPQFVMLSRDMIDAARWMADRHPPESSIACWRIGALAYYTDFVVIDTIGLTDRTLAAAANEAEREAYLRSRNPDLVLLPGQPGAPVQSPKMIYGLVYNHARTFPQGSDETWELYERRKQAHP